MCRHNLTFVFLPFTIADVISLSWRALLAFVLNLFIVKYNTCCSPPPPEKQASFSWKHSGLKGPQSALGWGAKGGHLVGSLAEDIYLD